MRVSRHAIPFHLRGKSRARPCLHCYWWAQCSAWSRGGSRSTNTHIRKNTKMKMTQTIRCILFVGLVCGLAPCGFAQNLVKNGGFEAGTNGFKSDYTYAPSWNTTEGEFTVRSDPQNWNGEFAATPDHTSGTGMVLVVNGATSPTSVVWEETVTVSPFTAYQFQAWLSSAVAGGPAKLIVKVNGVQVGPSTFAPDNPGVWRPFARSWDSGSATNATIRIYDVNLDVFPNDFYLDDIAFQTEPTTPFLKIGMRGGVPSVEIYSQIGRTNTLQYASALGGTNSWTALTNVLAESSPMLILDDPVMTLTQRFYRVIQQR